MHVCGNSIWGNRNRRKWKNNGEHFCHEIVFLYHYMCSMCEKVFSISKASQPLHYPHDTVNVNINNLIRKTKVCMCSMWNCTYKYSARRHEGALLVLLITYWFVFIHTYQCPFSPTFWHRLLMNMVIVVGRSLVCMYLFLSEK